MSDPGKTSFELSTTLRAVRAIRGRPCPRSILQSRQTRTGEAAAPSQPSCCAKIGQPLPAAFTVSRAPSPIVRTRRQRVSSRQASRGVSGSNPAATSSRHNASTGAELRTVTPSASQRSRPKSNARIGACAKFRCGLVSRMTCRCSHLGFCPDNCPGDPPDVCAGGSQLAGFEGKDLVGVAGFEPATPSSRTRWRPDQHESASKY